MTDKVEPKLVEGAPARKNDQQAEETSRESRRRLRRRLRRRQH